MDFNNDKIIQIEQNNQNENKIVILSLKFNDFFRI